MIKINTRERFPSTDICNEITEFKILSILNYHTKKNFGNMIEYIHMILNTYKEYLQHAYFISNHLKLIHDDVNDNFMHKQFTINMIFAHF